METDSHWLVSAGLVTSSIIAITANSFLLLIFYRRRGLRTVPNRFVINLLFANLLSSLLLIPLLIVDQSIPTSQNATSSMETYNNSMEISKFVIQEDDEEVISERITNSTEDVEIIETKHVVSSVTFLNKTITIATDKIVLCYFSQVSTSFVCTLSILSILLIGINQYFGVIHSLRYHFYINKCRSTVFIVTTWLVALLFSVLSSLTNSDSCLWQLCQDTKNSELIRIVSTVYSLVYFVVVILSPFVAICVIYVCIYRAAHKNSERMRKSTSANLDIYKTDESDDSDVSNSNKTLPKVQSAPNFTHFEVGSSATNNNSSRCDNNININNKVTRTSSERSTNFITCLKHKISNASVFKYREETRAAKISILVIFLVLICYVPYGVTLVLNSGLVDVRTSRTFNYVSLLLLIFSNMISPFLFAYRNKRVKREIGKVFGLVPPKKVDRLSVLNRRKSMIDDHFVGASKQPFLGHDYTVPEVIVTCKVENERKSILKRVCQSSNWTNYKKCNFITVPDSCISGEARGSFSSASTQISNDDC